MNQLKVSPLYLLIAILEASGDLDRFLVRRQALVDMEKQMHFSYDLEATLTDEERIADQILSKLKQKELKNDNYNIVIHDYFTNFVSAQTFTVHTYCLFQL